MIKRQNCSILRYYIDYGDWLNVAFELHYLDKLADKVTFTWKDFIEREIGIQDSYARKMREIAKVLGKYPRFRKLGLSFSEIQKSNTKHAGNRR